MFTEKILNPQVQNDSRKNSVTISESVGSITFLNPDKILHENSIKFKLKQFLSSLTVEPVLLLAMFAFAVIGIVTQNLFIERICRVKLNHSAELCANLTSNIKSDEITDDLRAQVYALTSRFSVYNEIITSVIPIIFVFFLGSWTDKHGNKYPFLLCICGYLLTAGLFLLISRLPDLPAEYLLVCMLPVALTGGSAAASLTSFSYISSVTTPENRSTRMALLQGCIILGIPAGLLAGAKLYKSYGFLGVYVTSVVVFAVAVIYGIIFIRDENSKLGNTCCSDMVNITAVKETFVTVFIRRDDHKRLFIFLLISITCFRTLSQLGNSSCLFLYSRYTFGWTEQEYSLFTTIECFVAMVGVIVMSFGGLKYLKLEDSLVGVISCLGFVAGSFLIAFAPRDPSYSWIMYVFATLQMFGGMVSIVTRSMISKIVPGDELGKIYAFVACADTALPIFGSIMYSSIFVRTQKELPGAFSLLSAGFDFMVVSILAYLFLSGRKKTVFKNNS
ncbi:unnamed protein product [Allacma fusca]|uniref:Proton-coupled folate transporter n=1 Tax=Allacma fusca TaxID=39272 RepID=A0A8J2P887_9HEXA|nr:unnamed protein product [Allacma fusca]